MRALARALGLLAGWLLVTLLERVSAAAERLQVVDQGPVDGDGGDQLAAA